MSCCSKQNHGPGYSSPLDAFKNGPNEQWLYVTCVKSNKTCPDYLATVDVDPQSKTYSQIIDRTFMSNIGDELHHSVFFFSFFFFHSLINFSVNYRDGMLAAVVIMIIVKIVIN